MKTFNTPLSIFIFLLFSSNAHSEWSGNISVQNRLFIEDPVITNNEQHNNYISISSEAEYYHAWNNNSQSMTLTPFIRIDQYDDERTHGDMRELSYQQVFSNWELLLGISKVYWGVTESQHLVDVINQTDSVENIDGEDKLGQPMIKASFEQDWGIVDLFILPYFRERTFQDSEGRPRSVFVVDMDQASYESSDKENHIDYAARWFNYFGDLELGIAYFNGTSREPLFVPGNLPGTAAPYYPLMEQYSIDAQLTTEEWLWKLEIIQRDWQKSDFNSAAFVDEHFFATTGGFEYTFVGIASSDADLGLVVEYLYDDRGKNSSGFLQNDIMSGLRLAMNDAESTEGLLGIIFDLDNNERLISLEASRRFAESWTASLEIRAFSNIHQTSLLKSLEQDDFIQLDISYYF